MNHMTKQNSRNVSKTQDKMTSPFASNTKVKQKLSSFKIKSASVD